MSRFAQHCRRFFLPSKTSKPVLLLAYLGFFGWLYFLWFTWTNYKETTSPPGYRIGFIMSGLPDGPPWILNEYVYAHRLEAALITIEEIAHLKYVDDPYDETPRLKNLCAVFVQQKKNGEWVTHTLRSVDYHQNQPQKQGAP